MLFEHNFIEEIRWKAKEKEAKKIKLGKEREVKRKGEREGKVMKEKRE